ncbi:MraY family glycosyltransferase [Costertonia aggregata]|uniref:Undecaprenyl/decaprenyl-phosphate alpha-N-acetylglucosaminyl 1-phosphate transferase n=1 Tax=Costertonia aggregata TaxID=343403 RepID=A0A7H9AMA7_9FLAO|nr:MraY family glycosyltransferase [Costertonia aggregata]QLG44579.1 undecaprenyl/decaprenyl-phosphate alpha-N-acetylglucosaminyl 1-phosphate transferase [Costertonia aggregata]
MIIYLSNTKNLMDVPGERSMHMNKTPTLGGIGIFITFSLALILFGVFTKLPQEDLIKLLSLLGGTIILLFLGIKDDLITLSPKKKFSGQIISSAIVVIMTDVRIYDLNGILGIGELPYLISVLFSIFIFIFIINAFNLTDGIDGLAASIAIVSSTAFGVYFLLNGSFLLASISFILIGSLLGFLCFNLSDTRKIFMGDSGSMFIGFILVFQGINLLWMNGLESTYFTYNNAPIIVLAAFAFPIMDTTRVFIIRICKKRSPFTADRNHIHHRLLDLGLSHKTATLLICNVNILIVASTILLDVLNININVQLLIVFIMAPLLCLFPFFMVKEKGKIKFSMPKLAFL